MALAIDRAPRSERRGGESRDERRDYNEAITGDHPGRHPASREAEPPARRRRSDSRP